MIRLILRFAAVLVGLLLIAVGASGSVASDPIAVDAVHHHSHDSHHQAGTPDQTLSERGPPSTTDRVTSDNAGGLRLIGALARSDHAAIAAPYGYDGTQRLVRTTRGRRVAEGRTGNGWAQPALVARSRVAAKAAPSAQEIIETTARAQAARGADALSGALSPAERAAMARQPWLQKPMLGQAVHRETARELEKAYPGRFTYSTRGPDFLDNSTGELLELTTPGQVGAHLARPGYGGVTMCTYTLGAC